MRRKYMRWDLWGAVRLISCGDIAFGCLSRAVRFIECGGINWVLGVGRGGISCAEGLYAVRLMGSVGLISCYDIPCGAWCVVGLTTCRRTHRVRGIIRARWGRLRAVGLRVVGLRAVGLIACCGINCVWWDCARWFSACDGN